MRACAWPLHLDISSLAICCDAIRVPLRISVPEFASATMSVMDEIDSEGFSLFALDFMSVCLSVHSWTQRVTSCWNARSSGVPVPFWNSMLSGGPNPFVVFPRADPPPFRRVRFERSTPECRSPPDRFLELSLMIRLVRAQMLSSLLLL